MNAMLIDTVLNQIDVKGHVTLVDSLASLCNSLSPYSAPAIQFQRIGGPIAITNLTVEETKNPVGVYTSLSLSISNLRVHRGSGLTGGVTVEGIVIGSSYSSMVCIEP